MDVEFFLYFLLYHILWYSKSMDMNNYVLDGTDLNSFVNNLRESLKGSYDAAQANIENQRKLDNAAIMSQANKAGTLFSNFPQRAKIQYQTGTYLPNLIKAQNTYQTGLNSLRNNTIDLVNQIKSVQEAIADLNEI